MKNIVTNKSKLKKIIAKAGFRINNPNLEYISKIISEKTIVLLDQIIRNARISGRKTIKEEDTKIIK